MGEQKSASLRLEMPHFALLKWDVVCSFFGRESVGEGSLGRAISLTHGAFCGGRAYGLAKSFVGSA